MPVIDHLFSIPPLRRGIWRIWYPYLTRRLRADDVLFLNYAFEEDPPQNLPLDQADEKNRGCIQLYHHVASQVDLSGRHILEVSCGHGGGASYLTRTVRSGSYTAMDLNPAGIDFCRKRHRLEQLRFVRGDAEHLPFADGAFDVVLNVEASHCYPHFAGFLSEVTRVLRTGGHFLYADFRFHSGLREWDLALANSGLRPVSRRMIGADVLRGMDRNSVKSAALIERHLPRWLHSLGRDFAGVTGSRVYRELQEGRLSYRSYCMTK